MNIDINTLKKDILDISINQAYQWIKTNHWTLREFALWVKVTNLASYQQGFDTGYQGAEEHIVDFMEKNDER